MGNLILDATFYRHNQVRGLQSMEIHQKTGNHSLVKITYEFREKFRYLLPPSDTPVTIRWGESPLGVQTFHGYVNHYDTDSSGNKASTVLVCVGMSQPLNSTSPGTWNGMTRSGIVREIAKRNKFRSVVSTHNEVISSYSAGGRSDFRILNDLADEIGFTLWVNDATVMFLDPSQVLRMGNYGAIKVTGDKVINQKVTGGINAPKDGSPPVRRRLLYGLDDSTNELFVATGGRQSRIQSVVTAPANNFHQALSVTQAAQRDDDSFFTSKVKMLGNARVSPGVLVDASTNHVNPDLNGRWFVSGAVHRISHQNFTTEWVGARGGDHTARTRSLVTVPGIQRQVGAVIRDGKRWEAELQEHVNV